MNIKYCNVLFVSLLALLIVVVVVVRSVTLVCFLNNLVMCATHTFCLCAQPSIPPITAPDTTAGVHRCSLCAVIPTIPPLAS